MSINLDDFVIRRGSSGDVSGVTVDTATGLTGGGTSGDIPIAIGTVPLANGGTGATTASAARTALGLGTLAPLDTSDIFTRHMDSSGTATQINYDSHIKYVTATGALGTTITGTGTLADPYVITLTSPDTTGSSYTLPAATSSALGGVKIISTASSAPMQLVTTTANRNYSIQHMTGAQAMVNVPWTDTTYNLATASVSGLCQVYNAVEEDSTVCEEVVEGRRYKIQHDADTDLSVCVPWTDTVYTHPTSAGNKHIPAGGSAGNFLKYTSAGTAAWATFPNTITTAQANAITANTAKVTFPGFGTTSGTALEGDTALLALGTTSTTALRGDTETITTAQADAITANTAKVTFPGIGTSSTTCMAGNTSIPVDLTVSGAGTVHADNYTDTNTQLPLIDSDTMSGASSTNVASAESVKAYVDARYSYQYLHFSFKGNNWTTDCWLSPSQNGPEYYLWNNTHGSGGAEGASHAPEDVTTGTTIEIDIYDKPSGFVIPLDCKLVGFYGNCRTNNTSPQTLAPVVGLFRLAEPADLHNTDVDATVVAYHKYNGTTHTNMKNRFLKMSSMTWDVDLDAGDLLFPAVGFDDSGTGGLWGSFTIVLKTLIT